MHATTTSQPPATRTSQTPCACNTPAPHQPGSWPPTAPASTPTRRVGGTRLVSPSCHSRRAGCARRRGAAACDPCAGAHPAHRRRGQCGERASGVFGQSRAGAQVLGPVRSAPGSARPLVRALFAPWTTPCRPRLETKCLDTNQQDHSRGMHTNMLLRAQGLRPGCTRAQKHARTAVVIIKVSSLLIESLLKV